MNQEKTKNKIVVSAPGKLMLFGEHSVVYGYPCIVTAMDTRMRVEAERSENGQDIIITPQVKESKFVQRTIKRFKKEFNIRDSLVIQTMGDFSSEVGLGSSSAVTVATFKALSVLFRKPLSNKEIFDLSYQVTIDIQGVGSGFDIAAATYGKTLYYIFGGKKIELLKTSELPLVVGYSGLKADTPTLIRKVKKEYEKDKKIYTKLFEDITILVEKAKKGIINHDYRTLGNCMNKNHTLLQKLGVSTSKLDQMIEAARESGAYGAKLSGAGGGDCMIALVSNEKRKVVERAIKEVDGEIIRVSNNTEGAKVE